tara:strand:+ start:1025 stop:1789 length:765 start_codon:yes stop_codon:yes gene_type:complete
MNILEKIIGNKLVEIQKSNFVIDEDINRKNIRSLKTALSNPSFSVIAEIKMKSPSEGNILVDADPVQIAKDYENAGASAISVITDSYFFGGSLEILKSVRRAVNIPVLRKDFILTTEQISETTCAGGDAFLLIMEALKPPEMKKLFSYGQNLGLESLIEFHEIKKIEEVLSLDASIVGVNCRNLQTMDTDLNHLKVAFPFLPKKTLKVAESGIKNKKDLNFVADLGYDAALVGTSLMRTGNPGRALEILIKDLT